MATIKSDDAVIVKGANVKLLAEAGKLSTAFFTVQPGYNAGRSTGNFPVVNGVTYVECSDHYDIVPTGLGGGYDKTLLQYVAAEEVVGEVPTPTGTPPKPGTPVVPGPTTATPGPQPGNDPSEPVTPPATDSAKTSPWLTYGLGAVLLLSIIGLVVIITRKPKNA